MMAKPQKNEQGFTIIELLMAAAVFSLVLLIAVIGFIQVGKMFYKSVEIGKTNDAASNIVSSVTTDLRAFSVGDNFPSINNPISSVSGYSGPGGNNDGWTCIGVHRYTYFLSEYSRQIVSLNSPLAAAGLIRDDIGKNGNCSTPFNLDGSLKSFGPNAQQMLGDGMSLGEFFIYQPNATSYPTLYKLKVVVGFGDNSSGGVFGFNGSQTDPSWPGVPANTMACRGVLGTNFCAVSSLDTYAILGEALQ